MKDSPLCLIYEEGEGRCAACGAVIPSGYEVAYFPGSGEPVRMCPECLKRFIQKEAKL